MIHVTAQKDRADRPVPDLKALNPAECEALALLAEGHTVKSIAGLTGRSLAAINERLREARRKTGIGSSRELARLFAAQKNRDEKIDLAASAASDAAPISSTGTNSRWKKGRIVMPLILIGGLAAALIAAQTEQGLAGATHVPPDAEILSLLAPVDVRTQTAELHELVRRERRDDAWARDVESMVRGRYSEIPHMNDTGEVRVTCAASLCEVAQILPGPDQANQQDQNALDLALQSDALRSDLAKLGLTYQSSSFKDDGTKRKQTLFLAYWSRWQQPKPDALFDGKLGEDARGERRFYKQVRDETRDPAWAARMEKGLTALLQSQPSLSQGNHRIRVNCAATLCEISAMTAPRAPQPQIDAFYRDLQTWTYSTGIEKLGLKDAMIQFGDLPDKSRNVYIAYYRRNGA